MPDELPVGQQMPTIPDLQTANTDMFVHPYQNIAARVRRILLICWGAATLLACLLTTSHNTAAALNFQCNPSMHLCAPSLPSPSQIFCPDVSVRVYAMTAVNRDRHVSVCRDLCNTCFAALLCGQPLCVSVLLGVPVHPLLRLVHALTSGVFSCVFML